MPFVDEMKKSARKNQCHIFILGNYSPWILAHMWYILHYLFIFKGANNLRWLNDDPKWILQKFSKIVKILRILKCKIIIASLIPSPVSHKICHSAFHYVNKKLQKICQKYEQTSFMNLDLIFLNKHNVNMAYFKMDKIHLNSKGNKALATEIKRQISYSYSHVY